MSSRDMRIVCPRPNRFTVTDTESTFQCPPLVHSTIFRSQLSPLPWVKAISESAPYNVKNITDKKNVFSFDGDVYPENQTSRDLWLYIFDLYFNSCHTTVGLCADLFSTFTFASSNSLFRAPPNCCFRLLWADHENKWLQKADLSFRRISLYWSHCTRWVRSNEADGLP